MTDHEHNWAVDEIVLEPTYPPKELIVCVACGERSSRALVRPVVLTDAEAITLYRYVNGDNFEIGTLNAAMEKLEPAWDRALGSAAQLEFTT
jgi:hypothetical protein